MYLNVNIVIDIHRLTFDLLINTIWVGRTHWYLNVKTVVHRLTCFLSVIWLSRAHWYLNDKVEYGLLDLITSFFKLLVGIRVLSSMKKFGRSLNFND